jgi:CheY-like chemotaxis protein
MQADAPDRPLAIIVDDDADFARLLARRLEPAMAVEVRDTAIGLSSRLMTGPPPAVVFLDCMMPALTGSAVLALLGRHARLRESPVILMSASESFRDAANDHPQAVFVQKTGHVMPIVELALKRVAAGRT